VSEEVNKKFLAKNMTVQLSIPYTDPERHNTQRHRQTNRQQYCANSWDSTKQQ